MVQAGGQELTERFIQFFRNYYRDDIGQLAQEYPNESRSLYVDYNDLFQFDRDVAQEYLSVPDKMQDYAEEALRLYDIPADVSLGQANVRLHNLPAENSRSLADIRSRDLEKFIRLSGTVESTSRIQSEVVEASYECQRCGTLSHIPQPEFGDREPHECQGCERKGPFELNEERSTVEDFQRARLLERTPGEGNRLNRESVAVHLSDDLVGGLKPGETVSINGVLKRIGDESEHYDATLHDKYVKVLSFEEADDYPYLEITEEDIARIVELSNEPDIFGKITASIAPTIYGHEMEKQALAMQLFGGVEKTLPDESHIRGNIHVALVGDPGAAKTSLLKAASNLSPRSVNVNGPQSTKVGITAAATPSSGEADPWELQAGAIVLADKGLVCIDHFDGLSEAAQNALEGPMEQQVLNMSKASVTETLPAQSSVLATGNPKYGRFDQYEPIGEQINLEPALISRFDLIFTVTDQPEPEHDSRLAKQILKTNYAGELNTQRANNPRSELAQEEVEKVNEEVAPDIEADLMRKYIAYAKRHVYPTMSQEAKDAIEEFYVDLRSKGADEDAPVPLTARKLEALVRLSEASARTRLSDTVEKEDADRVIEIVRSSLEAIGVDGETGEFDADVVETGTSKTQRDRIKNIEELIRDIEEEYDEGAPIEEVIKRANAQGIDSEKAEKEIENLRRRGELYEPVQGYLRTS